MTINDTTRIDDGAKTVRNRLEAVPAVVSGFAVGIGLLAIAGWVWEIDRLKHLAPHLPAMNAMTAVAVILLASSLWLQRKPPEASQTQKAISRQRIAHLWAVLTIAVGLTRFAGYFLGWDFNIDQVLFHEKLLAEPMAPSSQMAPNTALNFVLLGFALLLMDVTIGDNQRPAEGITVVAALIALLGLIGYAYGVIELSGVATLFPMALHTATVFLALSLGILYARPNTGMMAVVTSAGAGGLLAGRLLPALVVVFILLGWLPLAGERYALFSVELGVALFLVSAIGITGALIWWGAKELYERERALQRTATELGRYFDVSLDPVCIAGTNGYFKQVNPAFTELLGYTRNELLSRPIRDFVHQDDRTVIPGGFEQISDQNRNLEFENRYQCKDGRWKWLSWKACAFPEEGRIYGAARDVSEERRLQRELAESHDKALEERARWRAVVNTAADGIINFGLDGVIEAFNPAAEQLFEYTAEEIIGQNVRMLMAEPYRYQFDDYIKNYLETGHAKIIDIGREVEGLRRDGSTFPMLLSVNHANVNNKTFFTGVVRDISDHKRRLDELNATREAAEVASRSKSEFLAAMSHEIRTPMNGVLGMLDVLHRTSLKGYQVEMVDLIRDSATSLLGIINDILDFSKIEAGRLDLENIPFDVKEVVEGVCQMLDRVAGKQDVELTTFTDPRIPDEMLGDGERLRQVLINLVNNAIKFSSKTDRPGRVAVRVVQADRTPASVCVTFQVIDNGIGMNDATQARLFQPFAQADSSTARHYGGTGLGLTISRQLIEMMQGDIIVQSAPDEGSTFTVRIHFPVVETHQSAENSSSEVAGLSCLLIGNGTSLVPDLAAYLTHAGATVERVDEIDSAQRWRETAAPGLWIWVIDLGDTHLTGDELQAVLGFQSDHDMQLRAVAIERGERRAPRQITEGIVTIDGNVLLRKTFLRAVAIACGRETQEPEVQSQSIQRSNDQQLELSREALQAQGRLILVAEDNETNQKVILQQLAQLGYAGDISQNGREALEQWRHGRYALLLSDLHMPEMDGYELTTAISRGKRVVQNTDRCADGQCTSR